MWIYDIMAHGTQSYVWTPREIITWSMIYWIQGPYGGARLYKEGLEASPFSHGFSKVLRLTSRRKVALRSVDLRIIFLMFISLLLFRSFQKISNIEL
jgi:hypothetical protein